MIVSHGKIKSVIHYDTLKILFTLNGSEPRPSGSCTMEIDDENEYKFVYKVRPAETKPFEDAFKSIIEKTMATIRQELMSKFEN